MPKSTRIDLVTEFEKAPPSTLFGQETVAAVLACSTATLERDRWKGTGIPFRKIGRQVRYVKAEVIAWLDQHATVSSTTQADFARREGEK